MQIKTILSYSAGVFMAFAGFDAIAQPDSVPYRCPTVKEARDSGTRTSINKKTVHWHITKNSSIPFDNPTTFEGVLLRKKDENSYDFSVECFYRSERNQKIAISPNSSFLWYVDGVAERTIGNEWKKSADGNMECTKSVSSCVFVLR